MKTINVQRLKEPSTYAGLASILGGVSLIVSSPWVSAAASVADAAAQGAASGQGWLGIGLSVLGAVASLAKDPSSPR
ncbi:hypothetical protein [Azospirillum thiophilum]|uniref:Uncharacterized protein n=1 Tax=Azospirillum thiophilum TaxID=528244 RepID=A0AAC8W5A1_9PROT|nr:hypothetical protein [Azospirillum thiophilum]ALG75141.1 hypothetical protein AL072_29800 [Azospirillum thiophilum]